MIGVRHVVVVVGLMTLCSAFRQHADADLAFSFIVLRLLSVVTHGEYDLVTCVEKMRVVAWCDLVRLVYWYRGSFLMCYRRCQEELLLTRNYRSVILCAFPGFVRPVCVILVNTFEYLIEKLFSRIYLIVSTLLSWALLHLDGNAVLLLW